MRIEFMVQPDAAEDLRLVRWEVRPVRIRLVANIIGGALIGIVAGGLGALAELGGLDWAWLVILPVVTLLARVPGVIRLERVIRRLASRRTAEQFRSFALTDEEIRVTTALGETAYRWPVVAAIVMLPGFYGLRTSDGVAAWIRRSALAPEQDAELGAFLAGRGLLVPVVPAA
ncbi:hypothetical protein HDA40_000351 [Hamadaea flava]|uniref:YcxB family protein n=1 Tax=Hamadaea flava TaxID=1742688 RepID=A0ABV8LTU4_9ACTN|nr:YcxB family protein [Hamadaea flava]MCP2321844.1 hypothetical protein [Hamadaea flava]